MPCYLKHYNERKNNINQNRKGWLEEMIPWIEGTRKNTKI